jgi:c(7)-type cytochrome triheme protein
MKIFAIVGISLALLMSSMAFAEVGGGNIVYEVKKIGNVTFSHDTHVTDRGFGCKDCHPGIFPQERSEKKHTMAEMRRHKSCGVCHNGKNAFDVRDNCYVCHNK